MKIYVVVISAVLLAVPSFARSSGRSSSTSRSSSSRITSRARTTTHPSSAKCASCARDGHGKIKRSPTAKRDFRRSNPCPSTGKTSGGCPGYVIDHRRALKRGGADAPGNMEWQTREQAKAKDRVE